MDFRGTLCMLKSEEWALWNSAQKSAFGREICLKSVITAEECSKRRASSRFNVLSLTSPRGSFLTTLIKMKMILIQER